MWHQLKKFITFRDRVLRVPNLAGSTQNHVPRRFWCRKYSGACGGQLAARQTNPSSFALPFERRGVGELSPVSLCSICRWHSTVEQDCPPSLWFTNLSELQAESFWRRRLDGSAATQIPPRGRRRTAGGGNPTAQPGAATGRRGLTLQSPRRPGWSVLDLVLAANPTAPRTERQRPRGPEGFGKFAPREGTASRLFPVMGGGWIKVPGRQI